MPDSGNLNMVSAGNSRNCELDLDDPVLGKLFDRKPFGFDHNLHTRDLFQLPAVRALAQKYDGHSEDYYVASGAAAPDQEFYSVNPTGLGLTDAFDHLNTRSIRILLKRPENYDPEFRRLLDRLIGQVIDHSDALKHDRIIRLFSSILVTSAATVTPFHFDPSAGFFFQITGEKVYHIYPPAELTELELEPFYFRGVTAIGQVELSRRDPKQGYVFHLAAGKGFHQPRNAPHWVETRRDLSVSFTFNFETERMRQTGRVRGFNCCLRKVGVNPSPPGAWPGLDAVKAEAMRALVPCRRALSAVKSLAFGR